MTNPVSQRDIDYALTLMVSWGRDQNQASSGGACRLAEAVIRHQQAEFERLQAENKRLRGRCAALAILAYPPGSPHLNEELVHEPKPQAEIDVIEAPLCQCQEGECHGPDVAQAYGHLCRAENPPPFCRKHPNTATADRGCVFCGTPPTV